jgi:hypothetical protein
MLNIGRAIDGFAAIPNACPDLRAEDVPLSGSKTCRRMNSSPGNTIALQRSCAALLGALGKLLF